MNKKGSLAEWSKALVLGTSRKGRGFESHSCQNNFCMHSGLNLRLTKKKQKKMLLQLGEARTHNPGISLCTVYKYRALTDCATGAY